MFGRFEQQISKITLRINPSKLGPGDYSFVSAEIESPGGYQYTVYGKWFSFDPPSIAKLDENCNTITALSEGSGIIKFNYQGSTVTNILTISSNKRSKPIQLTLLQPPEKD